MGGPLEVSVSGNNFENTLVALEQLTVGRDHNRGGIEVITENDKSGNPLQCHSDHVNVIGLKCVRHTIMSMGDKPNLLKTQATDRFLFNTVSDALNEVCAKLTNGNPESKKQINDKIEEIRNEFESHIVGGVNGGLARQIPLSRNDIKSLVCTVRVLQKMDVGQLLALKPEGLGELVDAAETNILAERKSQMTELKELASFAKGKWEGKDGGEGYLCMLEDGSVAKFLTHSDERENFDKMDLRTLSESDKKMINDATAKLKDKILNLAGRCGGTLRKQVEDLLNAGEAKGDLSPFISRKTVAKVVTLLGEKIGTVDGKAFDWGDVTRADTVEKSGLEFTFPLDSLSPSAKDIKAWLDKEQEKEAAWLKGAQKGAEGKVKDQEISEHCVNRLKDKKFTREAAIMLRSVFKLVKASDIGKVGENDGALKASDGNPFMEVEGTASAVVDKMLEEYGEGNVAVQVFADATNCGGGFISQREGQEEGNVRDVAMELFAFLDGMGYTELNQNPKGDHIKYSVDAMSGKSKLSSAWGYLVNGAKRLTNQVVTSAKGLAKKVKYLFTAMPSFRIDYSGDLNGSIDWLSKCRKFKTGNDLTAEQSKNVRAVFAEILNKKGPLANRINDLDKARALYDWGASEKQIKDFSGGKAPTQLSEMMMILDFGVFNEGDPRAFDVLKDPPNEVIGKLLDLVESGDYKDVLDEARKNYESTVRESVKTWIKMLRDSGVKCLVSGPMGAGLFRNPSKFLARIVAEEFVQNAGDLKFVFANVHGKDEDAKVWNDAFAKAWANKQTGAASVDDRRPPAPWTPPKVIVNADIGIDGLGEPGGLESVVEDKLLDIRGPGDLSVPLKNMTDEEKEQVTDYKSGCAFILNKISTMSAYLKEADEKTKNSYLKFLKSAKKTLSTKNADDEWIRMALKDRDLKHIDGMTLRSAVTAAINAVEKYLADKAKGDVG